MVEGDLFRHNVFQIVQNRYRIEKRFKKSISGFFGEALRSYTAGGVYRVSNFAPNLGAQKTGFSNFAPKPGIYNFAPKLKKSCFLRFFITYDLFT